MANVYYFANIGNNGAAWAGYFEVSSTSDVVSSTLPSNIVVTFPSSFSFSPAEFKNYAGDYVTWRTYTGPSQYQSIGDGYSFDVWSQEFYDKVIVSNYTWLQLISNVGSLGQGLYSLRPDKYTHIYDYGPADTINPKALYHGKSGYLQLSTFQVP